MIWNFPPLDFLVRKIKEWWEYDKNHFCHYLPYFFNILPGLFCPKK